MIPVYNGNSLYLREAIESVLIQALPESQMQIEVVDDCSSAFDVQELVREVGGGRVGYFRQPCNVGNLRNFETCLNLSRGEYIHILHSDDVIHYGFYEQLTELFQTYDNIGAAFSRYRDVDESGKILGLADVEAPVPCVLENWLFRLAQRKRIECAGVAVKRKVYEKLGGFCGVHYCEDWEMWARIAGEYQFAYTPAVLVSCRRHFDSITGQSVVSGQNLKDIDYIIRKISTYLPAEQRSVALREARKYHAYEAVRMARRHWTQSGRTTGVFSQIAQAWGMHKNPLLAMEIVKLLAKVMTGRK
jgi:glycosyltransferase involved in cell wall biosynthesis